MKLSACLAALFGAILFMLPAAAAPVDAGHARVELISERDAALPGETIYAALKMDLDNGWHVYWLNAGDAGLPPQLIAQPGSDIEADAIGEIVWPLPHLLPVVEGEIMDYGYNNEVVFPFPITIPEDAMGPVTLDVVADYLICEDTCVPEQAHVKLKLETDQSAANTRDGELIGKWIAKSDVPFPGEARVLKKNLDWTLSLRLDGGFGKVHSIRFFPFGHDILHPAAQPVELGRHGATLSLSAADITAVSKPLEGVVVIEQEDGTRTGYEISAAEGTPLPDTSGLGPAGGMAGLQVAAWKLILLAILGGLILNLMPCVLPVLSMKAFGMVSAVSGGHAGEVRRHGIWYTAGVLVSFGVLAAIIVALRAATGPVTLGFQLQNAPVVAILVLVMFAVGLWLMGMFELGTSLQNLGSGLADRDGDAGAFFTGVLAAVVGSPCVGPFLGAALGAVMGHSAPVVFTFFLAMGFGLALPFLVLSFVPNLYKLLPRPGKWMDTLKQFFAFPMFLTAAWLAKVLGDLAGSGAVAWTATGAVAIAFAAWLWQREARLPRILAVVTLALAVFGVAERAMAPAPALGASSAYAAKYEAEPWSAGRVQSLVAEGRPVFIDFTASWCATCQVNKATTLKSRAVHDFFAANDVAFLVADFTRKDPAIAAELARHQRAGVPMYLWYPAGSDVPQVLPEILNQGLVTSLPLTP
ncbi:MULTISPECIES: protein-disulfide reductase DsbD family protein [Hyphomonas]|uniref:Cytochrome C biogenesis protein n=1 Tax=Hyphomonas adhaerens TaxID=81029 RepID=A0A3B9H1V1_9PROT|nr:MULTISPECIES: protein-disulfide reductase DsbD domain-containing protein [Hyphomonas]MBB41159.1 cytochrome C biogenesis protein [Hyphomonas sp.]HAE28244.1 cytochrome C biogenesis protein [Hyphomonas adhaerens]|tara:strand:- start:8144 stop:10234 length:2091 start_codon:yes stop_codon:yes gene_type:complete